MSTPAPFGDPRPREYAVATVGYLFAACLLLYPVFTRGGGEIYSPSSILAQPIAAWVMWILSWGVRALTSSVGLFDANVFYPAPSSLAYGDSLLGVLPFFAPSYLLTGDPVFSYQLTLLVTLALCGASMYYLARHWGVGVPAALVAGLLYAFCPPRLGVLAEFSYLSGQFVPLALVFADRATVRGRLRDAFLLFVFASWQVLCGSQLAYVSLIVLTTYTMAAVLVRAGGWQWRGFGLAVAAILGATGVLLLSNGPYRSSVAAGMFTGRTMFEFASFGSADVWRTYLVPPYLDRLGLDFPGGGLYLGVAAVLLAMVGAVAALRARRRTLVQILCLAAVCYALSLGPDIAGGVLSPYRVALEVLPGFAVLGPAPSRFAMFLMIAVAGLAALGLDRIRNRLDGRSGVAGVLVVGLAAGVILVDYRLPFQTFETQRILFGAEHRPLDATLAGLPPGPVLELPSEPCAVNELGATIERQLASTLHWKPLLSGYRSHDRAPATYEVVEALANALPDPRVFDLLRRATGVRYVVVHLTDLPGDWRHRWRSVDGLTRLGFFGQDLLLEVGEDLDADLLDELLSLPGRKRTLTGVPVVGLEESQRSASLRFVRLPPRVGVIGTGIRAEVLVENRSDVVWPGLTPDRDGKVYLSYLWSDSAGNLAGGDARAQALPLDLAPGESVVVPVCVDIPAVAGELDLAFDLTQSENWFGDYSERVRVTVVP